MLQVRRESNEDIEKIAAINRQAFESETEPNLIAAIRESEYFIPELSLVAELDGEPVGHILFSVISIREGARVWEALSLAPMAVLPSHQKHGVGSELVRQGLKECKRLGFDIVIVIGHPEYYPRFGFKPARSRGLEVAFDVPDDAFLVIELEEGALDGVSGMVQFPPAFDTAG